MVGKLLIHVVLFFRDQGNTDQVMKQPVFFIVYRIEKSINVYVIFRIMDASTL